MKLFCTALLLLLFVSTLTNGQIEAGKIISNEDARSLFGETNIQIKFSSSTLKDFALKSKYLLVNIIEGSLIIADQDKNMLYPDGYKLSGNEQFHMYSASVIQELINKSGQENVVIELRGETLTITNGSYTLEYGLLCPPYCY